MNEAGPDPKNRYPHLLAPVKLGPMTLAHRAVMSAHQLGLGDESGKVTRRYQRYLVERAKGGAALVGTESAPIHKSSGTKTSDIRLFDDAVIPSLARLADQIHRHGSKLSITLWHGGHNVSFLDGMPAVSASQIPNLSRETPRALLRSEIREIVAAYGTAASRCARAGLDAVEVQTATGYLVGSFLSPALNHRDDEYGGSAKNRMRIVVEILETIRDAVAGQIAVGVRTSTSHHLPHAPIDYTIENSIEAMQMISERGLTDWVSLLSGSRWAGHETIPPMDTKRSQLAAEGARFKAAMTTPIIIAGRIRTASEAEKIIADGSADVVAMARTWIAEPEWMKKIVAGRESTIRPCMSCSQACAGFAFRGIPGSCVINPLAGREIDFPAIKRGPKGTKVAVVGGGPAGLEVSRQCGLRSHSVHLYEAGSELGGQMLLAARSPHRSEMLPVIAWWKDELDRLGVQVHLGEAIDDNNSLQADHLIWATGSTASQTAVLRLRPFLVQGIPGSGGLVHGRDIMSGAATAAGSVAVIDEEGGWPAVSLAETLAAAATVDNVTVVTTELRLGESQLDFTRELAGAAERLSQAAIRVEAGALVEAIENNHLTLRGGRRLGPFDQIILSTGSASNPFPENATAVGDCLAPRGLWAATTDAVRVARTL